MRAEREVLKDFAALRLHSPREPVVPETEKRRGNVGFGGLWSFPEEHSRDRRALDEIRVIVDTACRDRIGRERRAVRELSASVSSRPVSGWLK